MKTIYIYCEGPTEESFINAVLYPYFLGMGIYVCPIVCETRRDANRKYRGGVSRYAKVKNELMILCKSHPHEYVTTMFDYLRLKLVALRHHLFSHQRLTHRFCLLKQ